MAERKVAFRETRQIRRNGETIKWWAGQTYDFDPDMQPMIDIGHASFLDEAQAVETVQPQSSEANPPSRADRRMQRRAPINADNSARPN